MKLLRATLALLAAAWLSAAHAQIPGISPTLMLAGQASSNPTCPDGGNDIFTKILLHFDGNLTDFNAAGVANVWSQVGTATTTGSAKFGTASLDVQNPVNNTASSAVETTTKAAFNLGSQDFTVDMWLFAGSTSFQGYVMGYGSTSAGGGPGFNLSADVNGGLNIQITASVCPTSSCLTVVSPRSSTGAAYHHFALVRNGSTYTAYMDGVGGTPVTNASSIGNATRDFIVGARNFINLGGWRGLIDEFRYSVGVARWTSNFTPPTMAYCTP